MADNTKIEWTDATWNIVTGCSVVSPGCTNCYAMRLAGTRLKHHPSRVGLTRDTKAGPVWTGEVRFNREWLDQPLHWKKPRMIFVAAHGDLFAEGVTDEQLDQIFAVMALCPQHIFQVLTKRPERMREYLTDDDKMQQLAWTALEIAQTYQGTSTQQLVIPNREDDDPHFSPWPLRNVWLGVSVEDQPRADKRIPVLLDTPAAIRWVSAEPILGDLDLRKFMWPVHPRWPGKYQSPDEAKAAGAEVTYHRQALVWAHARFIDWVVAGGESGPDARPMHPHWAYMLRDQCAAAGVPFLFKQWGNWIVASHDNGHFDSSMAANDAVWLDVDGRQAKPSCDGMAEPIGMFRVTKSRAGRLLNGVEHNGFPPLPEHFKEHAHD